MHYFRIYYFLTLLLSLFCGLTQASQHSNGKYTVHYNLFNSSFIQPEVAKINNLKRSKNIALLNISVIKGSGTEQEIPVIANIIGHGTTLTGQLKRLAFKEIKEENAIYYIAAITVNHGDYLNFDLQVQPEKVGKLIPIKFKEKIYID